jgi:hypothetical protein
MAIRIASLIVSGLLVGTAASAQAATTGEMLFGAGIKFLDSPLSDLLGIGAGFMDELIRADACLTGGEKAAEAAARSGAALSILGATVGAVTGAAIGGDMSSIAKGGAAGAAAGALAGAAGGNRAVAGAVEATRERERRQVIDLCQLAGKARELHKPIWADFARIAAPVCRVDPSRIFTGNNAVDDFVVNQCVRKNPQLVASFREHLVVIRSINYSACRTGQYVVAEYDRQRRDEAVRGGGSFMPTPKVECTGSGLASQWSWLLK